MDPYIGEIRICCFNFAPQNWAFCNGAILPAEQYIGLFSVIGPTYGGDGVSTFALPDLQGRVPVGAGTSNGATYQLGVFAGSESVTLTTQQLPAHNHPL